MRDIQIVLKVNIVYDPKLARVFPIYFLNGLGLES